MRRIICVDAQYGVKITVDIEESFFNELRNAAIAGDVELEPLLKQVATHTIETHWDSEAR